MKTNRNYLFRLLSLLFGISVFISACGGQNSNHDQSNTGAQKVVALSGDQPAFYVYNSAEACGEVTPCITSIQAAIDAASAGDTVKVLSGTYNENIILKSGVVVQGEGAATTTIHGNGGTVVTANGVDSNAKIDGFTITGGNADNGGAINSYDSSPVISNLVITGNIASQFGGGIYNARSAPTVFNVTVTGNTAFCGGGIYSGENSSLTISKTTIMGNTSTYGGGITSYSSFLFISDTTVAGNSAIYGGGIHNAYSALTLKNSTVSGNSAGAFGGGIYNVMAASAITNSNISGNDANYGGGIYTAGRYHSTIYNAVITGNFATSEGGGIWQGSNTSQLVINATITRNIASSGGGIRSVGLTEIRNSIITSNAGGGISGYATSDYNDLWNNANYDYYGLSAGPYDISADPKFVDAANGDYRLQSDSPCIEAGANSLIPSTLTTDLYGNPRIDDGNGDGMALVDIGVAERHVPLTVSVVSPTDNLSMSDVVTLQARTTDAESVKFFVQEPGGIPIGYDNLVATKFENAPGYWLCTFNSTRLADGYYIVYATAGNSDGAEVTSTRVTFSVRNWATELFNDLPTKAGRTMAIKFSVRFVSGVDPLQTFVHNESVEIRIYNADFTELLQVYHYGFTTTDYRIDDAAELYLANFKTGKSPTTYNIEIRRGELVMGQFKVNTEK